DRARHPRDYNGAVRPQQRTLGTRPICVAILRCSVAPLLGVALLRLRCSLPSRLVSLATRPSTRRRASSRSQLAPVPAAPFWLATRPSLGPSKVTATRARRASRVDVLHCAHARSVRSAAE